MGEFMALFCLTVIFFGGVGVGVMESKNSIPDCDIELKNKYTETINNKKNDIEIMKKYHRNQINCTITEEINKRIIEDLKR